MTNKAANRIMAVCPHCFRALAAGIPPSIILWRLTHRWPRDRIDLKVLP